MGQCSGMRCMANDMHTFTESWDCWEMHPHGEEVVLCVEGEFTLLQEGSDGTVKKTKLRSGEYAVNGRGVWHSADVAEGAKGSAVFITAGMGTQHRKRHL